MRTVPIDLTASEHLVCSGCYEFTTYRTDETFGHDRVYHDAVSTCCGEPVCSSATGKELTLIEASRIERSYNEPI